MSDERIAELEMQLAFQDNAMQELNDVVIRQQEQIDQLQKSIQLLEDKVQHLKDSAVTPAAEDAPPPHY